MKQELFTLVLQYNSYNVGFREKRFLKFTNLRHFLILGKWDPWGGSSPVFPGFPQFSPVLPRYNVVWLLYHVHKSSCTHAVDAGRGAPKGGRGSRAGGLGEPSAFPAGFVS